MTNKIWTVKEVLDWTQNYLKQKGIKEARLDTEHILSRVLNISRMELYLQLDRPMNRKELQLFKSLIKRRAKREPLQYIIGKASIWKHEFFIEEGVFIPRKDTETLIECAISFIKRKKAKKIIDVGTGCGCIAISILKDVPHTCVVATDISMKALFLTKRNALKLNVEDRVFPVKTNILSGVKDESFDMIVSNPPYIPESEIEALEPEIKFFEPQKAINGGRDGLSFIRKLIKDSYNKLKSGGGIIIEVGYNQSHAVKFLLERSGFVKVSIHKDLNGIERVVAGWKP